MGVNFAPLHILGGIVDFFKFNVDSGSPTILRRGEMINNITHSMWAERYRGGEFQFTAPTSSGLRELLPAGTCVSHIDSEEIMVVENHQIPEDADTNPYITVTGRSLETFLENRIVGANRTWPITGVTTIPLPEYSLAAAKTWVQAQQLINDHILPSAVINASDGVDGIRTEHSISNTGVGSSVQQIIPLGTVYQRLLEVLAIDDLGIKAVRPGPTSPYAAPNEYVVFVIHDGIDRRNQILISYDTGDIKNADYLWSNKKKKTAALVTGRWVQVMVGGSTSGFDKRVMTIDGSDIDNAFTSAPTGTDLTDIQTLMTNRANAVLASQNDVIIIKPEMSKTLSRYSYRNDYRVGDIVTVIGNYGISSAMRVIEYVEIEDENGETGYPTLAVI